MPIARQPTIWEVAAAESRRFVNAAPLHASVPDWHSNNSRTNSPGVRSQLVLTRGLECSCAVANLRQVAWLGEGVPLPRPRLRVVHGTVLPKCARKTLPARSGMLYRP